jgi:FkbM family methyltransferase
LAENAPVAASFDAEKTRVELAALKGDLPRFSALIAADEKIAEGDHVTFRVPLDAATIWDADFATIFAGTIEVDNPENVKEVWLGIGEDGGLALEESRAQARFVHIASAWRFRTPPINPYLQIRIVMHAAPSATRVMASRLFAGHNYDPYVLNPHYASFAERDGRSTFEGCASVLAEFERKARLACQTAAFYSEQAFVRPFIVKREGELQFPMLIGTVNSIRWYGVDPRHNLEEYEDWGCIDEGDVAMDCGAHAGQMATFFSLVVGPCGRVIAFDPFAQNCLQVEAQASLNPSGHTRVVKAGVGAKRQTIRVSNLEQKTTAAAVQERDDQIEIEIVPLDDFIDEKPTFIKLDIEGAEVDALIGAANILRTCMPKLFIEVHTQYIGQFGYNLTDFFSKIPADLYDMYVMVLDENAQWRLYEPGLEIGVTVPLLVFAAPKHLTAASDWKPPGQHKRKGRPGGARSLLELREAEIRNMAGMLLEREATIGVKDDVIREREAAIAELDGLVKLREADLESRGSLIREREATIAHLERLVGQREAWLDERAGLLLQREETVRQREETIRLLEAALREKQGAVHERER